MGNPIAEHHHINRRADLHDLNPQTNCWRPERSKSLRNPTPESRPNLRSFGGFGSLRRPLAWRQIEFIRSMGCAANHQSEYDFPSACPWIELAISRGAAG
jgi:hypothetical protein